MAGDDAHEQLSGESIGGEPESMPSELIPMAPPVELVAVTDSEQETEEKVPFYKREISFGRKKVETSAPAAEAPAEIEEEIEEESADPAEKVPFYKRELSFRRGGESAAQEELAGEIAFEPVAVDSQPDFESDVAEEAEEPADEIAFEPVAVDSESEPSFDAAEEAGEPVAGEPELEFTPAPQASEPDAAESEVVSVDEPADAADPVESDDLIFAAADAGSDAAEEAAEPVVELEPLPELDAPTEQIPAAVSKVPLHKRELFGKNGKQSSTQKKGRGGGNRRSRPQDRRSEDRRLAARGRRRSARPTAATSCSSSPARPLEPGIVRRRRGSRRRRARHAVKPSSTTRSCRRRDVRIGVASNRIGVRTLEIAGVEDESPLRQRRPLQGARGAAGRASASPCSTTACSRSASARTGEPIRRVLLVVAPRDQVEPYVDVAAARPASSSPGSTSRRSDCCARSSSPASSALPDDTSTVVVVDRPRVVDAARLRRRRLRVHPRLRLGRRALQEAIAQELEVHPAEAATILRHLSLSGPGRAYEALDEDASKRRPMRSG